MKKAREEAIIRAARRALRRDKRCPHHKCEHRGEQHVRRGSACAVKGCTCPDIGAVVYVIPLTVEVTYLRPNEVHDEGFYRLLSGVFDRGGQGYKKYRFELMSVDDIREVRTLRKGGR